MRFFDVHLHLPTPDRAGLDALLRHIESEPAMIGGLLVLNTEHEVDLVSAHLGELPETLGLVPYFEGGKRFGEPFERIGWRKIHPAVQRIRLGDVAALCAAVKDGPPLRGVMVHCFPWGKTLDYNTSLPLVLALAEALPETTILATHGGGYESWAFRSHAALFKNVIFDFSVSLSYYSRSDLLRPYQRYFRYSPDRVVFGSDWPSAECGEQIEESVRLAEEIGLSREWLEETWLANSRRLWPELLAGTK
ncbi:MAG: amidohydrolase 2 [Acidobacteria bacterium]|nr:amidohydrolase 2 [Acidobacteriota bacterium]